MMIECQIICQKECQIEGWNDYAIYPDGMLENRNYVRLVFQGGDYSKKVALVVFSKVQLFLLLLLLLLLLFLHLLLRLFVVLISSASSGCSWARLGPNTTSPAPDAVGRGPPGPHIKNVRIDAR